ncbi:hypothetical protein [Sodalis-like endosymbiont of Proechinophthirus fluctus]|uniref:hypothetical protein n=1 Tax=Sodalis-like endosymbiont of Proechinophthirus fluctus TaxID=1462730 RepID=UPI00164FB995|nr:hypothetical protein [Sodalis-like endosymbiont of Proechinophthirus fluctus]
MDQKLGIMGDMGPERAKGRDNAFVSVRVVEYVRDVPSRILGKQMTKSTPR